MDYSDTNYAYARINLDDCIKFNIITPENGLIEYRLSYGNDFSKIIRETYPMIDVDGLKKFLDYSNLLIKLKEVR